MTLEELHSKFKEYNIPPSWYSINDGTKPSAFIVQKNYSFWEYFVIDDDGKHVRYRMFANEYLAYDYLWSQILFQLSVISKPPKY